MFGIFLNSTVNVYFLQRKRGYTHESVCDSDWNSRNTIIQYNYSHDNDGGLLLICNDGSQSPKDSAGNVGTIVRHNISQNDHHRGIKLSGPVKNTLVHNNTIYVGKGESVDIVLHTDWTSWVKGTEHLLKTALVLGESTALNAKWAATRQREAG